MGEKSYQTLASVEGCWWYLAEVKTKPNKGLQAWVHVPTAETGHSFVSKSLDSQP